MKNLYIVIAMLFCFNETIAQWTKISSVRTNDIVALAVNSNIIYAASDSNEIYKSTDGGISWDTLKVSNTPIDILTLAFYDNKIYAGTYTHGIYVSSDSGVTWNISGSSPNWNSAFAIRNEVLYTATLGAGVYVLDTVTDNWSAMNDSLPFNTSWNVNSIVSAPGYLMIAAGANGTFYTYDFNTHYWTEKYYYGTYKPGLLIHKLIISGDTIFAVNGNSIIKSSDAGATWADDKSGTHNGASRFIYEGTANHYTLTNIASGGAWIQQRNKYAPVGSDWAVNEEIFPTGFSYDIIEYNGKLFLGKNNGLYFNNQVLGVGSNATDAYLKIYPCPSANGIMNIESNKNIVSLEMLNSLGQAVYTTEANNIHIQFQAPFHDGIYCLRINFKDGSQTTKVVGYE